MKKRICRWIKKILLSILVVFTVTTITFFLMHTIKGDPFSASIEDIDNAARQQYIEKYGLNEPIVYQYLIFLRNLLVYGDSGVSMVNRTSTVSDIIRSSLGTSLILGSLSVMIGTFAGFVIGAVSAYIRNELLKHLLSFLCIVGISLPIFVWAPFLQNIISLELHLLPISGWGCVSNMILPIMCMLPNTITTIMKYTKNSIEKIRSSSFYIASKQRGFTEFYVFRKHILKNAVPPIITVLVSSLSGIFTGTFVVEKIFSIPGIGRSFMSAITMRDYPVIIGLNIIFTIVYVVCRLLGDFFQELCNPLFKEGDDI